MRRSPATPRDSGTARQMIREYFSGRTLLITGGTGFLGQALIAKILRDLPRVERIYAFARPGRGANRQTLSAAERVERMLAEDSVFRRHRDGDPGGFARQAAKVVAVPWDTDKPDFGVEAAMLDRLRDEIDTVVNSAATVVFDEPLDDSIRLNTHGPVALLKFAAGCRKPVDFVHVSTAYVNGRLTGDIPEQLLPPDRNIRQIAHPAKASAPFDPEREIAACEAFCRGVYEEGRGEARRREFKRAILRQHRSRPLSESRIEKLTEDRSRQWIERRLVDEGMRRARKNGWNDVYTFTKAMGEQLLAKNRGGQALVIVRPSIIESSLEDPEPGWITGLKVMDPLVAAYGKGMLPDFPARPDLAPRHRPGRRRRQHHPGGGGPGLHRGGAGLPRRHREPQPGADFPALRGPGDLLRRQPAPRPRRPRPGAGALDLPRHPRLPAEVPAQVLAAAGAPFLAAEAPAFRMELGFAAETPAPVDDEDPAAAGALLRRNLPSVHAPGMPLRHRPRPGAPRQPPGKRTAGFQHGRRAHRLGALHRRRPSARAQAARPRGRRGGGDLPRGPRAGRLGGGALAAGGGTADDPRPAALVLRPLRGEHGAADEAPRLLGEGHLRRAAGARRSPGAPVAALRARGRGPRAPVRGETAPSG